MRRMDLGLEPDLFVVRAIVERGDTVVDVGANIGLYSHWLTRWVGPGGHVLALEPIAETCAILHRLAQRLAWNNLTLVEGAASERDGTLWMHVPSDERRIPNHYLAHVSSFSEGARPVRAVSIDTLLDAAPATFIKIDVEGHELACLRGAIATIRRSMPALLVEINRDGSGLPAEGQAVIDTLCAEGYDPWTFDRDHGQLRPWDEKAAPVNVWFLQPSHLSRIRARCPELTLAGSAGAGS